MTAIRWLHLSDLHLGMMGHRHLWPQLQELFFDDLRRLYELCGPWDLVLFSGDLTQSGQAEEFRQLDVLLGEIWDCFAKLGCNPHLFVVPGNHDLTWPDQKDPAVKQLTRFHEDREVRESLFDKQPAHYHDVVNKAFANYQSWRQTCSVPLLTGRDGILPGDCAATFEREGLRLGLLGLNSAFLQMTRDDYLGRLALDVRQFHGACDGNGPRWAKAHHLCLLLTHHPPTWLHQMSRDALASEIASPGRFAIHLCGHMHHGFTRSLKISGSAPNRLWQANSLFGLEAFGTSGEARSHGYSAGQIEATPDGAHLRIWPRLARRNSAKIWGVVPDYAEFELEKDQGTEPDLAKYLAAPLEVAFQGTTPPPQGGAKPRPRLPRRPILLGPDAVTQRAHEGELSDKLDGKP